MTSALYAGSFDPITRGHIEVARLAATMFDTVFMVIAANGSKAGLFTQDERYGLARESLKEAGAPETIQLRMLRHSISIARLAENLGCKVLIRGVRPVSDFDSEFNLYALNKQIAPDIHTVFIPPPPPLMFGSSSAAKELVRLNEDVDWLVTPCVRKALTDQLSRT